MVVLVVVVVLVAAVRADICNATSLISVLLLKEETVALRVFVVTFVRRCSGCFFPCVLVREERSRVRSAWSLVLDLVAQRNLFKKCFFPRKTEVMRHFEI